MSPDLSSTIGMGVLLCIWIVGVILFVYKAVKKWGLKQSVENISTSKINSAAVGSMVEIKGNIVLPSQNMLKAPFSEKPCSFYYIDLFEPTRVAFLNQKFRFFPQNYLVVEDGSGAYALATFEDIYDTDGYNCDVRFWLRSNDISKKKITPDYFEKKSPKIFSDILQAFKKCYLLGAPTSMGATSRFDIEKKCEEHIFKQGEPVYIMGYAESASDLISDLDINKDGKIANREFKMGKKIIEGYIGEGDSLVQLKNVLSKAKIILKGTNDHPLVVASSERAAAIKSIWQGAGWIMLGLIGAALTLSLWWVMLQVFVTGPIGSPY